MSEKLILTIALMGGTGKVGPGLAMRWANAGYRVIIGSRDEAKAQGVAAELNETLGIDSITGMENSQAAEAADICVLTVNQEAHEATVKSLRQAVQGKIVVDTTARVDYKDPHPPGPPSAARMAQEVFGPGVRVVAAFQTVPAHALKKEIGQPLPMSVLVCADDVDAAEEVIKLARGADLRAYYAGDLDNAGTVEGLTALILAMNKHYGSRTGSLKVTGIESE
ncbi:MAG: NADPH-dependent F420 reductase [Anaerolineales bacterium]|jgi:NADPH-dependent F420 reductase